MTRIGRTEIVIKMGDLTEEEADALVNAANNELWMGGGVAGALKRKGGQAIESEAVARGPIGVGEAVATGGGTLRARYVIHAAVMAMDFRTDADIIARATQSTLARADELGLKSIAFPAFGTGVGRFPPDQAAHAMLATIKRHAERGTTALEHVSIILYDKPVFDAFDAVARVEMG